MPFNITPTEIPDVLIIEPKVFADSRGYFFESFNEWDFFQGTGIRAKFVQDNHSKSSKGVLRGLHYQLEQTQGKLVRVIRGSVFDVAVDLRQSSKTFGQWVGIELTAENKKQLWVPPGFAHGFLTMSDEAEFLYKTTNFWHATSEQCILWNDAILNIEWPNIGCEYIHNEKDAAGLSWDICQKFN
jgi:dTDP-4-dehydrorhamnose 3,5-epimerase